MKDSTDSLRASHVNQGTSVPHQELLWPARRGRVLRHPPLHVGEERGEVTPYGGLALAASLVRRLQLPQLLDAGLDLLKLHLPYHESDHVLALTYNLYVGGDNIEDLASLQGSEAARRMLGAARIPDPTTAGDFLRRFAPEDLEALDRVLDEAQKRVWHRRWGRKKQPLALVDVDSHVKHIQGLQKEGADFTYKGGYGYHPLAITLGQTQEVLRLVNRPGNAAACEGAAEHLDRVFPLLNQRFRKVVVRGDSAFYDHKLLRVCEEHGQYFALVAASYGGFNRLADAVPDEAWRPFQTRAERQRQARGIPKSKRRKRRPNLRRQKALQRKKRDLLLTGQWVTEVEYHVPRLGRAYRLVIRRQRIDETDRQGDLFEVWRYRFALTNLSKRTHSAEDVLDLTYCRCDQENVIEQLQNGVAAMRMPTGDFLANAAWLCCARLAHNLKCWMAQIALPAETMRWKWKRFRHAFVYVGATVVHHARQVHVRLAVAHRYHRMLLHAHQRLQL